MDQDRRTLLNATATLGAAALLAENANAAAAPAAAPARAVPLGRPGEFDFLAGEWRIAHRRQPSPGAAWDEFTGEATCWTILGGVGSIEELRIPARNFAGMGLRLLDVSANVWNDFWVNARSGALTTPGQTGGFVNGVGTFEANEMDGETPIVVRGVWDEITPTSCRWRQLISRDAGASFQESWVMQWRRA